jgi:thymidylate kinase
MPFIAILGCDGSGKSAVIAAIDAEWCRRNQPLRRGHWRPGTGSALAAAAAKDPHGVAPRGGVGSFFKLGWLWYNWWRGWWRGLRGAARGGLVVFDRYHADLLVDPLRYRYGGPEVLARWASRLMPQPDLVIFLDADEGVLLSRKQEVSRDALAKARGGYHRLIGELPNGRVVDAARSLDEVVAEVIGLIDGWTRDKEDGR